MTTVLVSGWTKGFQKIQFSLLLQTELGRSLASAKHATDMILDGKSVELQVPDGEAGRVVNAMEGLGVRCSVAVPAQ